MPDSYLFAGDREVAVQALRVLHELGDPPLVLCVSDRAGASHADELEALFKEIGGRHVVPGSRLRSAETVAWLRSLELDLALSVHFPDVVRAAALEAPRRGWLNLHPAFLPYNRGWHTPSWAILEGAPAGATLHEMVAAVDAGRIVARREVPVSPGDTAHTLYRKLLEVEVALLRETWRDVREGGGRRPIENDPAQGSLHRRDELLHDDVRLLDLDQPTTAGEVIDRLRALTTDRWSEAARYEVGGRRFAVRVEIRPEDDSDPPSIPA
jgi:methionyl-tRNA formyltransferase